MVAGFPPLEDLPGHAEPEADPEEPGGHPVRDAAATLRAHSAPDGRRPEAGHLRQGEPVRDGAAAVREPGELHLQHNRGEAAHARGRGPLLRQQERAAGGGVRAGEEGAQEAGPREGAEPAREAGPCERRRV